MSDMTSAAAIDLLDNLIGMVDDNQENDYDSALHMAIDALKAQAERTEERTETHACDCINRKDAIDAHYEYCNKHPDAGFPVWSLKILEDLPSAQPESKYEYHYDHTDCIWFRPEARNRCPATCAQYRDGWNDAMNYIFRDGKGYRPYRRDKQYGE